MGFTDLQTYFVDEFTAFLQAMQADATRYIIKDLFGTQTKERQAEVVNYIASLNISNDMTERPDQGKTLYILPSYPISNLPFPQIGVYLGADDTTDFYLGNYTGAPATPLMDGLTQIGWEIENGHWSGVNYRIDVVANSPDESIWLARLCQRAILGKLMVLDGLGVKEPRISVQDQRLEQEQFPAMVFARSITFTAKVAQTWKEILPYTVYATGLNK